jgi:hypothetical protein
MGHRTSRTTTLWNLIDRLQRRLEGAGIDRDVVDVAVTRGVEAWLEVDKPVRARPRRGPSLTVLAAAKA